MKNDNLNTNLCPLCNSTAKLLELNHPGYEENTKFEIYLCIKCDSQFALPFVNDTKFIYDLIYRNQQNVPGYNRYWHLSRNIKFKKDPLKYLADKEETYWAVKEVINSVKNKDIKILEVGSGLGYLTYALNQANFNTIGIDISKEAVDNAISNFGNYYENKDVFDYSEKMRGKYDIIILTEVIEHIHNPLEFITTLKKMINKDGKIIVTTPNKSIFPKEVIWDTELPPVHWWWFSETSFLYMANELGMDVKFVNFSRYYSNKFRISNIKNIINSGYRTSIINSDGVIKNSKYNTETKNLKNKLFSFFSNKFTLYFLKFIIKTLKKRTIVYDEKGITICAVFSYSN